MACAPWLSGVGLTENSMSFLSRQAWRSYSSLNIRPNYINVTCGVPLPTACHQTDLDIHIYNCPDTEHSPAIWLDAVIKLYVATPPETPP